MTVTKRMRAVAIEDPGSVTWLSDRSRLSAHAYGERHGGLGAFHGSGQRLDPGRCFITKGGQLQVDRMGNSWPAVILPSRLLVIRADLAESLRADWPSLRLEEIRFRRLYDYESYVLRCRRTRAVVSPGAIDALADTPSLHSGAPHYFEVRMAFVSDDANVDGPYLELRNPRSRMMWGATGATTRLALDWLDENPAFWWKGPCVTDRLLDQLHPHLPAEFFDTCELSSGR